MLGVGKVGIRVNQLGRELELVLMIILCLEKRTGQFVSKPALTTPLEGLFRDNETNNTNENNRIKNPNWREANQLAIYKELNQALTQNNTS